MRPISVFMEELIRNCRYYAKENPHWVEAMPIHSPQVHVWAGICLRGIIGPYFFEESVTNARYASMFFVFHIAPPSQLCVH